MGEPEGRRPLKVRDVGFAHKIAAALSRTGVTPNQISLARVAFAIAGAACFLAFGRLDHAPYWWLPIVAGAFIQLRLLCNLFDGMVAVEGGKSSPSGELFNDIPDRVADPVLLVSAGYAVTSVSWAPELGWLCGLLAVMTAYLRNLAVSIGAPADFTGPMAKQHRMAVLTVASLAVSAEAFVTGRGYSMAVALAVIAVGCVLTVARRALNAYRYLETSQSV